MVIAAADDPVEISDYLWEGFSGDLAFEVGANVGRSIPRMKSKFQRVIAFEPNPDTYEIASKVPGADVRPIAISDHDGEVELILSTDQMMSEGHEAYNRPNPDDRPDDSDRRTVPCLTLDTIAAREGFPNFINVDTEGHELAVLHGAAGMIKKSSPSWLIEFHSKQLHDDCVSYLENAGYTVETIRHPHYPKESVNWFEHGWLRAHLTSVEAAHQVPERKMLTRPAPTDPQEIEQLLWNSFSGDLAFDVGANAGQSLWFMTGKFMQVVAFEPAHESFRPLKRNWGENEGINLRNMAISDHEGTIVTSLRETALQRGDLVAAGMPYKKYIDGITSGSESLPWGPEIGTREVPCQTLDNLSGIIENEGEIFGVPDFVKIDTEGHEVQILAGASNLLKKAVTSWLIEFYLDANFVEIYDMLVAAGYRAELIRHPHYQPQSKLWRNHGWIRAMAPQEKG
jgi:FkbM family methyltransferase